MNSKLTRKMGFSSTSVSKDRTEVLFVQFVDIHFRWGKEELYLSPEDDVSEEGLALGGQSSTILLIAPG